MDEQAAVRNFRDFLTVYNSFTEKCFNHCVSNLNYRVLTPEEELCVDRCSSKLININHRVIGTYMEVSPMARMMAESQKQTETSQAEGALIPPVEGGNPGAAVVNTESGTDIASNVPVQANTDTEQNVVTEDSQR